MNPNKKLKRRHILLTDDDNHDAVEEAHRDGKPFSRWVRDLIKFYLNYRRCELRANVIKCCELSQMRFGKKKKYCADCGEPIEKKKRNSFDFTIDTV